MPAFPAELLAFVNAEGLRASRFEFPRIPGRDWEMAGTAVVGAPVTLVALREQVPEEIHTFLSEVLPYTEEAVLYFPDYHLEGEQETP